MKGNPMPIEPTDLKRVLLAVEKCVIVSSGPGKMLFVMLANELRVEINNLVLDETDLGPTTSPEPPPKRPFIERLMDRWT